MWQTLFQDPEKQTLNKYESDLLKIKSFAKKYSVLDDSELKNVTLNLKQRLEKDNSFENIKHESFALVQEGTFRVLGMKHFDVQLIGGLILSQGKIAEMKTGEGKTLVALLPAFLYGLSGKGVHVVTVNDYLARRDASYVGKVHEFLGLSVGLIQENLTAEERQRAYKADIIYVTNNELGFDYLRDNMVLDQSELVQRPFFYCLIDEVDSILIDEARTPLIISGSSNAPVEKYEQTSKLASNLKKDFHYLVDEKNQNITLTEKGARFCEQVLNISDLYNINNPYISYIVNSLKAIELFKLNKNYIINENSEIVIVDEFTGRIMEGRRWSDGLHQAIEAKENVKIQDESQTLASITYQNLFLLYDKLAGMTGTAKSEEVEFEKIYNLEVVSIPTNKKIQRKDFSDQVYKNQYFKWQAIAKECLNFYSIGRPVLIGTTTIEKSELLAALLAEYKVPYNILNARPENVEKEADIIAQAGCLKTITISTNMAGRGTDILLGGNIKNFTFNELRKLLTNDPVDFIDVDLLTRAKAYYKKLVKDLENNTKALDVLNNDALEGLVLEQPLNPIGDLYNIIYEEKEKLLKEEKLQVKSLGGLHVIGTERHESRRIDNQLRGRSGRQGDPGSSRFFLSLEDRLLRLFGGDKILDVMKNIGFDDTIPIESKFLDQSLETAQKKVEAYYFDSRKQLFEYDEALNLQRDSVYTERKLIITKDNLRDWIIEYGERSLIDFIVYLKYLKANSQLNSTILTELNYKIQDLLGLPFAVTLTTEDIDFDDLLTKLRQAFYISYDLKEAEMEAVKPGLFREIEKSFLLNQIDFIWKEHLQRLSLLKESIMWRAYGQKTPLTEYKNEAFQLFVIMLTRIRHRVVYFTLKSRIIISE